MDLSFLQVEGCTCDLMGENVKKYYRRNKVCEAHQRDLAVIIKGEPFRYCQQVRYDHAQVYE